MDDKEFIENLTPVVKLWAATLENWHQMHRQLMNQMHQSGIKKFYYEYDRDYLTEILKSFEQGRIPDEYQPLSTLRSLIRLIIEDITNPKKAQESRNYMRSLGRPVFLGWNIKDTPPRFVILDEHGELYGHDRERVKELSEIYLQNPIVNDDDEGFEAYRFRIWLDARQLINELIQENIRGWGKNRSDEQHDTSSEYNNQSTQPTEPIGENEPLATDNSINLELLKAKGISKLDTEPEAAFDHLKKTYQEIINEFERVKEDFSPHPTGKRYYKLPEKFRSYKRHFEKGLKKQASKLFFTHFKSQFDEIGLTEVPQNW